MKIDGGCLCGYITYEAEVSPDRVAVCHCTDCQTHSGTAFGVVVGITDNQFQLLTGELKTYQKIADSGTTRALAFCPECGTRIHARTENDNSKFFGLRVGTVTQRVELVPKVQVWCRSAQTWLGDLSSIPKVEKQPQL